MNASLSTLTSDPIAGESVKLQSEFQSILEMSVGQDWTVLVFSIVSAERVDEKYAVSAVL